ncbi:MAG: hypothetical protein Q7S06_00035 [Nanoarchaeota archaeon]|nr:hypothetical protein [Nanoarchaeota archaeon]
MKKLGVFLFLVILISSVTADVISVNSGGDNQLIINPDAYVEGFFSCVPKTCSYFGYNCDSWSDGCGLTINCGTCGAGFTCTSGICTAIPVTPGVPGGGGAGTPSGVILEIIPKEFNLRMAIDKAQTEIIRITNKGTSAGKLFITQSNLNGLVLFMNESNNIIDSIDITPGETKILNSRFVAPSEAGIYTGRILIGGEIVLVTMNIKTKLLLFDSNIAVLNKDYLVGKNEELKTKVTLIPLGDQERLDVLLNYTIRDYTGKIYITQSETVLVDKQIDFRKNFDIGLLPLGDYIVGLELVYPGGIAPSSAHFTIVEQSPSGFFGKLIFWLIIFILLIFIMIVILLIKKRRDRENGR